MLSKLMRTRDVGFLKYWTVSNIPLFLLAAPMLYILAQSARWGCGWTRTASGASKETTRSTTGKRKTKEPKSTSFTNRDILRRISIPQAVLATLALTNYHVQVITRLSSGYPVWYWWLASMIIDARDPQIFGRRWRPAKTTVRWIIIYGVVQGGLFASFLPPA